MILPFFIKGISWDILINLKDKSLRNRLTSKTISLAISLQLMEETLKIIATVDATDNDTVLKSLLNTFKDVNIIKAKYVVVATNFIAAELLSLDLYSNFFNINSIDYNFKKITKRKIVWCTFDDKQINSHLSKHPFLSHDAHAAQITLNGINFFCFFIFYTV